jgi:hypothetical protein
MIRRGCASEIGEFSSQLDKLFVISEIIPILNKLSKDEQDTVRVMCLKALIPISKPLSDEENQSHTIPTLKELGKDKSWKVRVSFTNNFLSLAETFGKEITNSDLI